MLARTTPTFCLEIRGHLPANCAFSSVVGDGGYVVMTSPATSPTPWRRGRRGRGRDPCTLSTEASLVVCRQAPGCLHCFREVVLKSADDHVEWIGPSPIAEGRSHHVKLSLHVAICDRDTLQHGALVICDSDVGDWVHDFPASKLDFPCCAGFSGAGAERTPDD